MAYNVEFFTYPEEVDRKKVEADLDAYVALKDWEESCSGLPNPIRWLDIVCGTEEEAEEYIENHDNQDCDCLAVKFHVVPMEALKTKRYLDLLGQQSKAWNKYKDEDTEIRPQGQKSVYVTCRTCGSKLTRHVLLQKLGPGANFCPLCSADLRSPTVLKAIEKARDRYIQISAEVKEEEKRAAKNNKEIRWLLKIEYHT